MARNKTLGKARAKTKLGELLLARGWLDRSGLERALATQSVIGGRLGTCLLELGLVDEDHLSQALAELRRLPAVLPEDLRQVPDPVLALLPSKLAMRHGAVPFRTLGGRLDVAMLDAADLTALDELAFASGKRVQAHVAPEVRVLEALDRFYGQEVPKRVARILDRINRVRYLWAGDGGEPEPTTEPEPWEGAEELFPLPDLFDEGPEAPLPAPPPVPAAAAAPKPVRPPSASAPAPAPPPPAARARRRSTPEKAERALAAAEDAEAVGEALIDALLDTFERVALFAVHRDRVAGWLAGGDIDRERLKRLSIPFDQPSVFLNLHQGSGLHLGPLAPMPAHRKLARCWGADEPPDCLLAAVRPGGRLALVIYADRGEAPPAAIDLPRIRRLTAVAAATLERCILLKKQRKASTGLH